MIKLIYFNAEYILLALGVSEITCINFDKGLYIFCICSLNVFVLGFVLCWREGKEAFY